MSLLREPGKTFAIQHITCTCIDVIKKNCHGKDLQTAGRLERRKNPNQNIKQVETL